MLEACADRLAQERYLDLVEARKLVRDKHGERGLFVWEMFRSRSNDPTNFELVINADSFPHCGHDVDRS